MDGSGARAARPCGAIAMRGLASDIIADRRAGAGSGRIGRRGIPTRSSAARSLSRDERL
ncbi:hypothetical protein BC2230_30830 [Burkholderia cepacia]